MAYDGVREWPGGECPDRWSWPQQAVAAVGGALPEDALGRWVGRRLHEAFGAAMAEPLPSEWLRLIDEAAARGQRGP